jgi:hypothetical protein
VELLDVWRRAWRRLWTDRRVDLTSPLPVADAEERLTASITPGLRRLRWTANVDVRVVSGTVSNGRVRLVGREIGRSRGATRSMLRAELVPDGRGSRLVGRLGIPPQLRALATVVLTLCAVFFVIAVVAEVRSVATGTWTPGLIVFLVGPLVLAPMFLFMAGGQDAVGRADDAFLLDRVGKALAMTDDVRVEPPDA